MSGLLPLWKSSTGVSWVFSTQLAGSAVAQSGGTATNDGLSVCDVPSEVRLNSSNRLPLSRNIDAPPPKMNWAPLPLTSFAVPPAFVMASASVAQGDAYWGLPSQVAGAPAETPCITVN